MALIVIKQPCPTFGCKMQTETLLNEGDVIPRARRCVSCEPRGRVPSTEAVFVGFLQRLEREVSDPLRTIAADTLHALGIVD